MLNHAEALKQQELLSYPTARNTLVPEKQKDNEVNSDIEIDLHEIQVDDDLNEPNAEDEDLEKEG